jgi:Zn-finger nucleic acid-binding protein
MPLFGGAPKAPMPDGAMDCPRDGARLVKVHVAAGSLSNGRDVDRTDPAGSVRVQRESVTLDKCPSCSGLWFDATELKRVAHDKDLESLAARVRAFAQPSPFACPRCGGACVTSHVQDVEVDTCTLCHGIWLDAGELEEAKREVDTARLLEGSSPGLRSFLRRV